jgi:uncharacterized protein
MKKLFSLLLVLVLVLSMAVSVSAATDAFVYDDAGLLTEAEWVDLSTRLAQLSDTYNAQIVVVTIPSAEGNDPDTIVEYFYDNMGIGYGEGLDGVLLLVCMDPREYRILSNGYCAAAIDPADINAIGSVIVNDLSEGDYADAFDIFAEKCEYYLDGHLNGFSFNFGMNLMIALMVGLVAGLITAKSLKGQLKTVRQKNEAKNYIKSGSLNLHTRNDVFLYRDIRRTPKPRESTTRSSSGGSSRSVGGGSF